MGPDRHETSLVCDSTEQKPDCQVSLPAVISDSTSAVKPGAHVSKIPVSAFREQGFSRGGTKPVPGDTGGSAHAI